jgi:hypothetical protein
MLLIAYIDRRLPLPILGAEGWAIDEGLMPIYIIAKA